MLVSALNRTVRSIASGEDRETTMAVAVDNAGEAAAMVHYEVNEEAGAAVLWYRAVSAPMRLKGIGTGVYRSVIARIRNERPAIRALVYGVERPEDAEGEHRGLCERRIAFYRRNGARLLSGIRYTQSVGWQPPVRMHVMVHPFEALSAEAAFEMARSTLGDAVERVGALGLE